MKATEITLNVDYAYLPVAGGYNNGVPLKAHTLELLGAGKIRVRFVHPDPKVNEWEEVIPTRNLVHRWSAEDAELEREGWEVCRTERSLADRLTALGIVRNHRAYFGKGRLVRGNSRLANTVNTLTNNELDMLLSAAELAISLSDSLDKASST